MDFKISKGGKMKFGALVILIVILQAILVEAGQYCEYDNPFYDYAARYCSYGCCGISLSDYSKVCCSYSRSSSSNSASSALPVGVIVGAVIGGLAGISILITLITCCIAAANNSKRRTGTVTQPANTNMQTFTMNSTAISQGQAIIPVRQGPFENTFPSGGSLPPYGQPYTALPGYAKSANLLPPLSNVNIRALPQGQITFPVQQRPIEYGYTSGVPPSPYGQPNNVPSACADSDNPLPPAANVDITALSQEQITFPLQQRPIEYCYPSGGPPSPYGQPSNVPPDSDNPLPPAANG